MLTDEPAEYKLKMEIGTLTTLYWDIKRLSVCMPLNALKESRKR